MEEMKKEVTGKKPEKLDRDTLKRRIKKKVRIGYYVGIILLILAVAFQTIKEEGPAMFFFAIGILEMIAWRFISPYFWEKYAGNTTTCYECGTEIDLVDRWKCGDCEDVTRRHALSRCPNCKGVMKGFPCPSCETTLASYPRS